MPERTHAPDNLPNSYFEEFSVAYAEGSRQVLKRVNTHKTGSFPAIRAHNSSGSIRVKYQQIRDIEIALDGREFLGHELAEDSCAVSFFAEVEVSNRKGELVLFRTESDPALTRVIYWNLTKRDLFGLLFLRHKNDQKHFIQACDRPDILLSIAAELATADKPASTAAYRRAVGLLQNFKTPAEAAMLQLLAYIAAGLRSGAKANTARAVTDYRRLDRMGEAGHNLARLLNEYEWPIRRIEEILLESIARLLRFKPRQYSVQLCNILDFAISGQFAAMPLEHLLWQTYLAASAEREVPVLKEIWCRAIELRADRETLRIIYKTWRGFSRSESPQVAWDTAFFVENRHDDGKKMGKYGRIKNP